MGVWWLYAAVVAPLVIGVAIPLATRSGNGIPSMPAPYEPGQADE